MSAAASRDAGRSVHDRGLAVDLAWLGVLAAVLVVVFVWPVLASSWTIGAGPDESVYLWWARVGMAEGLSPVGARPGISALVATVAGTLGLPLIPAVAGLQQALGVSLGIGAVALVRGRAHGGRPGWALAGLMAGVFAVHLAAGYVANLAFATTFVAAAAALAARTRRGVVAAALLLGGGGLSHPQFFLAGAVILAAAAAMAWVLEPEHGWRSDAGRVLAALTGGGLVVGAGLTSMIAGDPRLPVDTSRDGFLRRAGLRPVLTDTYVERFRESIRRFAPWITLPLAAIGTLQVRDFTRRFLVSWAAATVVGVPVGIATGWFPPERVLTFGFALPILAALGITWIWERTEPRRWLTVSATIVLLAAFAAPSLNTQRSQRPFVETEALAAATLAGRIASTLPPDTPLVFVVDDVDRFVTFNSINTANVARAAVPPDRADDVHVFVGALDDLAVGRPTTTGEPELDALSRITLADIPTGDRAIFVSPEWNLTPSALVDDRLVTWRSGDAEVRSSVPDPRPLPAGADELEPSSPAAIALSTIGVLVLLWVVGAGWARWAFAGAVAAAASAPAFGIAATTIVALALDRVGAPLGSRWSAVAASALAALGGYGLLILQGKPAHDPAA